MLFLWAAPVCLGECAHQGWPLLMEAAEFWALTKVGCTLGMLRPLVVGLVCEGELEPGCC